MNLRYFLLPVLASLFLAGCSDKSSPGSKEEAPAKGAEPESRVKQGTNGLVQITLDEPTRKLMGLETAELASARLQPELKVYGRVLDSAPLVSLAAELITSQAEARVAEEELNRLKTLADQSNASQRALQAAQAGAVRSQAQLESARLRLVGGWGNAIAGRTDLSSFVQSLSSLASALVLLELPAAEALPDTPTGARILTLDQPGRPVPAQWLGPAPSVDPQMQGRGFLFLVSPNPARLAPGGALTGYLELPGEARTGVALPEDAVVRVNGATWVYRQARDDTFERLEVTLERPLETGWFIRAGLQPQDRVVVVGAQQLLSEELKGRLEAP